MHCREHDFTSTPRGVCGRFWWFEGTPSNNLGHSPSPATEVLTCSGYARHRFPLGDLPVTRPLAIDYVVRRQQGPERFRGWHGLLFQFSLQESAVQVARGSTTCRKFRESTAHFPCSWTCLLGLGHSGKPRVFTFGQSSHPGSETKSPHSSTNHRSLLREVKFAACAQAGLGKCSK